MEEIKKSLAIVQGRWQEVLLITGLSVMAMMAVIQMEQGQSEARASVMFLYTIFVMVLAIGTAMLRLGFLRTVYLDEGKPQQPMILLRTGSRFFWRVVVIGLLYAVAFVALSLMVFLVTKRIGNIEGDFITCAGWLRQLCFSAAGVILIKPLLLIPAIIIVVNSRVFQSFGLLGRCRLFEAKGLVGLFVIQTLFDFVEYIVREESGLSGMAMHVSLAAMLLVSHFLYLLMGVTAVRFVGSLNLVYDEQQYQRES